jgi:predicted dehydrogenase
MEKLKIAFIGTGQPRDGVGTADGGFFMAYFHWRAYKKLPDVEFVGCADVIRERAEEFARRTGTKAVYTDFREMIAKEKPDIVSVTTWTKEHSKIVIALAEVGVPAIHCEKPIASTWAEAQAMLAAVKKSGTRLTIDHQRRFGDQYQKLLHIKKSGQIGELKRMEACCPNLWDWGDHYLDMLQMMNDETPGAWAIGQLDFHKGEKWFGMYVEDKGIWHMGYQNGVEATFITGPDSKTRPGIRLIGTEGMAEYHWTQPNVWLLNNEQKGWQTFQESDGGWEDPSYWEVSFFDRAMAEVVNSFREKRKSMLDADVAIKGHEMAYACFESVRRRGLVCLPVDIQDNPMEDMVASGVLKIDSK